MDVELLYFDGCPNWRAVLDRLREHRRELGFRLLLHEVRSVREAEELDFPGSPTVRIDGHDPFAVRGQPAGLACRVYEAPDGPRGTPPWSELRRALEEATTAGG